MIFRRALLLADLDADPQAALSALEGVASGLEHVLIVAGLGGEGGLRSYAQAGEAEARARSAREALVAAASSIAPSVALRHAPELGVPALEELARTERIDLLAAGSRTLESVALVSRAGARLSLPTLWPAGAPRKGPARRVFCAAFGARARASVVAFFRAHGDPALEVTALGFNVGSGEELDAALKVAGLRGRVRALTGTILALPGALEAAARSEGVDLVVLARVPVPLLLGYDWPAPVLLVAELPAELAQARPLDVADAVELAGRIRVRVEQVSALGTVAPVASAELAFVSEGHVVATASTSAAGQVDLGTPAEAGVLGVARAHDDAALVALAAVEQRFTVLRPAGRGLLLFHAELPAAALRALAGSAQAAGLQPLAVRLRPSVRASVVRQRLSRAGLPSHVIDARAVLDEGEAHDVGEANDAVRLRRVALRLHRAGHRVACVLDPGLAEPETFVPPAEVWSAGNRVEIELDNARARTWLLEAIAGARESLSVQAYMAFDDAAGRAIEAALAAAAARGVVTRVLVDSLHGLHGSFGTENALLARLGASPGVELRVYRPLRGLPSVAELKGRDHRKLVVADDRLALVSGRNLCAEYYTGFEEARVGPATPFREVPWLDAGARIEGPAVAEVARSFLEAWVDAGGEPFAVRAPSPAGSTRLRVVVHRGLRDAHTLDAYRELIDGARRCLDVINGFPFLLELQHALILAVQRGVRVRVLTGHVAPKHGDTPFAGPWASARGAATEFVHSRLDPIAEAGGEVRVFALRDVPGWDAGLGVVYPHVHAKLVSADAERCAVGSVNLDVTSSYWESELMVVVDDAAVLKRLQARIDALFSGSARVDPGDPGFRERARQRAWMRKWPGVLGI